MNDYGEAATEFTEVRAPMPGMRPVAEGDVAELALFLATLDSLIDQLGDEIERLERQLAPLRREAAEKAQPNEPRRPPTSEITGLIAGDIDRLTLLRGRLAELRHTLVV